MEKFSNDFICATEEFSTKEKHVSAPYIRKVFHVSSFETAKLYICGLGFYKLYLNGVELTKGLLAPYISNPDDVVYYDEYDLTPHLTKGENVLGIILGNGFLNSVGGGVWDFDKASFRSAPKCALKLFIDGVEAVKSDSSFKTHPSPILFDDLRMGEEYDANKEIKGWCDIGYDDSAWNNALTATAPKGEKRLCKAEPINCHKEIKPISITPIEGGFLYDFGVNTSGVCKLKIEAEKDQAVTMQYGEVLLEGKSLYLNNLCCNKDEVIWWQKDIYRASGNGVEEYEPSFTYHGFRYVFVKGIYAKQATEDMLTLKQYYSSLEGFSSIRTDNEAVNGIQKMVLNSDVSNFFYFPNDCPHREKNGWTADIALSCEQMLYNFDCANSLKEWLFNVRKAQNEQGALPGIVPTSGWGFAWGNGPAWDSVLVELPYRIYKFTADRAVLQENEGAIAKYIDYLSTKINLNGTVAFGLPDWCDCSSVNEWETATPLEVSDTLVAIEICDKSAYIFNELGNTAYYEKAMKMKGDFIKAFRQNFVEGGAFVSCKTQTAQAKAIAVGVFGESELKTAVENLVSLIKKDGDRFMVGVIGARVLFRVLCENGYQDLALKLITQDKFPSYKYWLDRGYTSLGEKFYELYDNSILRKDGGKVISNNHHFWGDVSGVFYKYICGLNIEKAPYEITIKPLIFEDINRCECVYRRGGKKIEYTVEKIGGKNVVTIIKNDGFTVNLG